VPRAENIEGLKPKYLAESHQKRRSRWSTGRHLKTGKEALERRERAHANILKILRWWNDGMTIKGMAWKLKTERASVQWIIRKAIDGGRIKPDYERLRYPSEPGTNAEA
jgi:hypothetical protein